MGDMSSLLTSLKLSWHYKTLFEARIYASKHVQRGHCMIYSTAQFILCISIVFDISQNEWRSQDKSRKRCLISWSVCWCNARGPFQPPTVLGQ